MSFILDALKKSETDRQRQTSPALFEVKVAAPRRRFPVWAIALGVLLGVNLLVAGLGSAARAARSAPRCRRAPPSAARQQQAEAPAAPPGMVTVPATATYIPANAAPNVTVGPQQP